MGIDSNFAQNFFKKLLFSEYDDESQTRSFSVVVTITIAIINEQNKMDPL